MSSPSGLFAACVYLALSLVPSLGVAWVCAASLVSGIFGGYTGVVAAGLAYISEVVEVKHRLYQLYVALGRRLLQFPFPARSQRVSIAEGCIFLAATLGPFLSAALYSSLGDTAVFAVHALCHLANLLYCLWLPEPVVEDRPKASVRSLFSFR